MDKLDKATRQQYRTKVLEDFPETLNVGTTEFEKALSMRYGENPGYPAAFYKEVGAQGANMATLKVLQEGNKGLSYINVGDMDLGQRLVRKLKAVFPHHQSCALIKHEMPSGVALGEITAETLDKAWKCDSLSNFGSVDVISGRVDEDTASLLVESARNVEVVYAPAYTPQALDILQTRKSLRVVQMGEDPGAGSLDNGMEIKRVAGGLLVQKRFDSRITSAESLDVVSKRRPTEDEIEAALFTWTVACFTRSNAVVIGQKDKVHGIGSGQRSRVDAAEDAIRFSARGYGSKGCVLASDAFMPFPDVVELAASSGITAIIYPLGSIRDAEVIAAADKHDLAMIVTKRPDQTDSERCFLHR